MIPKDLYIYLNIFRKRLVTYLQQKYVGLHTYNSLFSTKNDLNYKDKVFLDSECLYATIRDAYQCITCPNIKPNNMVNIKCDLSFCDAFPECNITDEELYDGQNDSLIHFSVYTHQVICVTHGVIKNGPSLCRICE